MTPADCISQIENARIIVADFNSEQKDTVFTDLGDYVGLRLYDNNIYYYIKMPTEFLMTVCMYVAMPDMPHESVKENSVEVFCKRTEPQLDSYQKYQGAVLYDTKSKSGLTLMFYVLSGKIDDKFVYNNIIIKLFSVDLCMSIIRHYHEKDTKE